MKKILYYTLALFLGFTIASCEEDDLSPVSVFDDDVEMEKNELDIWLEKNYLDPYNLDFKYKMEDVESSMGNNLVPVDYTMAVKMARIVKHVWFEAYDEIAGVSFTRSYAPKVIVLIGSRQWNPNGTITLGYAEGGLKVTLVGCNWLDPTDIPGLNEWFLKTMHHEFAHILHQTKVYPVDYNKLSEGHYSPSGWHNRRNMEDYAPYGFVTAYGSSQPGEDIAEMTACLLTWTDAQWEELKEGAGEEGWAIIQTKMEMMNNYMKDSYGVDMMKLRSTIERRCAEIQTMDLESLE